MKRAILCFAMGLMASSVLAEGVDERQVLALSEAQRGHVLQEMRAMLAGMQNMLTALSSDDMAAVASHARPLGMAMARQAQGHLKGALPREFGQLGMSVHQDFDQIALDAESLKDPKHTLRQLGDTMNKCVACHAIYQIRPMAQPAQQQGMADQHQH